MRLLQLYDPNIKQWGLMVSKYCADVLCQPISYLFQLTIANSHIPSDWRTHCVIPIFKCGDCATISNYRPISLLCIISKVLEKIVFNVSINFLSNSFTPHQFGFLPGRSTLQQLLLFISMNYWKQKSKQSIGCHLSRLQEGV